MRLASCLCGSCGKCIERGRWRERQTRLREKGRARVTRTVTEAEMDRQAMEWLEQMGYGRTA